MFSDLRYSELNMPTYTQLKPQHYTVMFNKECDIYDYMQKTLSVLITDNKPLSYYQLQYRIKTSRIKKALDILINADCIVLLCCKYHITQKGRMVKPLLDVMLDSWYQT